LKLVHHLPDTDHASIFHLSAVAYRANKFIRILQFIT